MKRHDIVACKSMPDGPLGVIQRVARDGAWADVHWYKLNHTKRMQTIHIFVKQWRIESSQDGRVT